LAGAQEKNFGYTPRFKHLYTHMSRKIVTSILTLLMLASPSLFAQDSEKTFVFDLGRSSLNASRGHSEFDIYRIGMQREFKRTFWQGKNSSLSGYWEGSVNYWRADADDVFAVALSPVFVLSFGEDDGNYRPFIELGVGLALLSDDVVAGRQMGSSWQFEDRIGFGIKSEKMGFHYRYMHYSNGDLSKPNQGIDAHVVGMTYRF
jgi:lipid A 3-O-deacylase